MSKVVWVILIVVVLGAGLAGGYWYGTDTGYQAGRAVGDREGYQRAEAEAKQLQAAAARKVAEDAAQAANPFQAANPLSGVEDPFSKLSETLNPFK